MSQYISMSEPMPEQLEAADHDGWAEASDELVAVLQEEDFKGSLGEWLEARFKTEDADDATDASKNWGKALVTSAKRPLSPDSLTAHVQRTKRVRIDDGPGSNMSEASTTVGSHGGQGLAAMLEAPGVIVGNISMALTSGLLSSNARPENYGYDRPAAKMSEAGAATDMNVALATTFQHREVEPSTENDASGVTETHLDNTVSPAPSSTTALPSTGETYPAAAHFSEGGPSKAQIDAHRDPDASDSEQERIQKAAFYCHRMARQCCDTMDAVYAKGHRPNWPLTITSPRGVIFVDKGRSTVEGRAHIGDVMLNIYLGKSEPYGMFVRWRDNGYKW